MIGPSAPALTELEQLIPLVYSELKRLARSHMRRESPGHMLQTSALVNEAYLRLADQRDTRWQNRAHFFGIASQMMRNILVDYARRKHRAKRGGDAVAITLDDRLAIEPERPVEILALDEALNRLAAIDPRKARLVEMRFFGGLEMGEIAEVLGISANTATRDWNMARAWLRRWISEGGFDGA